MKKFNITIYETLSTTVEVDAESVEEAKEIVKEMYFDEKIILTADDFSYREIREENECEREEF